MPPEPKMGLAEDVKMSGQWKVAPRLLNGFGGSDALTPYHFGGGKVLKSFGGRFMK